MASIEYLSPEWYQREVGRLGQQLLNEQRAKYAIIARQWMLIDQMTKHGMLPDDAGMRANYQGEVERRIALENDRERLEEFRCACAMVLVEFEAKDARELVDDGAVLDAVLKAITRNLATCDRKDLDMAVIRERAAEEIASIPAQPPRLTENELALFDLPQAG